MRIISKLFKSVIEMILSSKILTIKDIEAHLLSINLQMRFFIVFRLFITVSKYLS